MARAHREVPPVTWVEECDFSGVDLKLLIPTVLKAVAAALQEYPELNARLEGDEIVYLDRYDIGVAVQTDAGARRPGRPRLRHAPRRRARRRRRAARRRGARAGKLAPEDLRGGTFTVTSAGKLGGLFQTPIVNHPEVAILEHRPDRRPAGRPRRRGRRPPRSGTIAITFDHRVVDGARAAEFGLAVIGRLEAG